MLKLLIVEDEKIVRDTLSSIIDWHAIHIDLIGTCENGVEAYHVIDKERPALVLTDIRMPGMDGLELIDKVVSAGMITEFILLSGYADFTYAKAAMKLHVAHYLIKPCNEKEIMQAVLSASEDYRKKLQMQIALPEYNPDASDHPDTMDAIEQILNYTNQHLSDDELSLKYIAEHVVYLRPDYVGKLFCKNTGEKFSAYLIKKRIEQAKKIFSKYAKIPVGKVAQYVGYGHNPLYFGQLFKHETGLTPKEYQKRLREKGAFTH